MLLSKRTILNFVMSACCCLILTGCFRPLYGTSPVTGVPMAQSLASVDLRPFNLSGDQEYFAHVLRTELVSELNGHGGSYAETPKRYQLQLAYSERMEVPHIDQVTSRADSSVIMGTLTLTLFDGTKQVYQDKVEAFVSYERVVQRYATLRAQRDAYSRLAKTLASQAKTSLAFYFVSGK